MGGVGKSTLVAAVLREADVLARYDKMCWASLGQTPDAMQLLKALHDQAPARLPPCPAAMAHHATALAAAAAAPI